MAIRYILSLDGGGIRGTLSARLLTRLEDERPGWLEKIDLFAGTSTGALIATGLAAGIPPSELTELYVEHAATIFDARFPGFALSGAYAFKARYHNRALKEIVGETFQERGISTLGDLPRRVLVASFDFAHPDGTSGRTTWAAKFFHNFPGEDSDGDEDVTEVLLKSAAAPTYFPAFHTFVDGGVVANNPSMCALAQAVRENGGEAFDEIVLLSLGTGRNVRPPLPRDADWGWTGWAFQPRLRPELGYETPIIDLILEGSVDLARYQCEQLLGERFQRLDPELPEPFGLDDIEKVEDLLKVADDFPLDDTLQWIDDHFPESQSSPVSTVQSSPASTAH